MLNMAFFKNSFFPSIIIEWNKLDFNIRYSEGLALFIRPSANSTFHCHNPNGLKPITELRLEFIHLRIHKFKHSFQDTSNSICNRGTIKTFFIDPIFEIKVF